MKRGKAGNKKLNQRTIGGQSVRKSLRDGVTQKKSNEEGERKENVKKKE